MFHRWQSHSPCRWWLWSRLSRCSCWCQTCGQVQRLSHTQCHCWFPCLHQLLWLGEPKISALYLISQSMLYTRNICISTGTLVLITHDTNIVQLVFSCKCLIWLILINVTWCDKKARKSLTVYRIYRIIVNISLFSSSMIILVQSRSLAVNLICTSANLYC